MKDALFKDPQSTEEQPICKTRVAIFFDDNLKKGKEKYPNPNERNIGFPKDVYDSGPVAWDDPGFIGIRVNSVKAALDEDYFIRKVIKELRKRGFNTSHLESTPGSI